MCSFSVPSCSSSGVSQRRGQRCRLKVHSKRSCRRSSKTVPMTAVTLAHLKMRNESQLRQKTRTCQYVAKKRVEKGAWFSTSTIGDRQLARAGVTPIEEGYHRHECGSFFTGTVCVCLIIASNAMTRTQTIICFSVREPGASLSPLAIRFECVHISVFC